MAADSFRSALNSDVIASNASVFPASPESNAVTMKLARNSETRAKKRAGKCKLPLTPLTPISTQLPLKHLQYIIPLQQSVLTMGKRALSACLALNLLYRKPDYWRLSLSWHLKVSTLTAVHCCALSGKSRAVLKRCRYSAITEIFPENFDVCFFFRNNC